MTSDLDYRAIRKRVEARLAEHKLRTRRVLLAVSAFIYVLFMAIGWGIFVGYGGLTASAALASGRSDSPLVGAMIMLSMAGALGLMFQAIGLSYDTKRGEERLRDRLVTQEINREMFKMGLDDVEEHEKRKGMMRLTDDGELEEVADDVAVLNDEAPLKQQR